MQTYYRVNSVKVPESLTQPGSRFKRNVFMAIIGLIAFVLIYFGLMIWFGLLAYKMLSLGSSLSEGTFFSFLSGIFLAFLSFFMLKSLFIFKQNREKPGRELDAKNEPALFNFLYQLADELGAPRPHKVYLSYGVNAAVFYDLNIFNLIFPSKKNLIIGLGLINRLNLGEFKAVLAHEFGHFAQKTMLLGRYVYVAQQVASRVVNKRDVLDQFLAGLSSIDIRIAWIGWILSILVWSIRSLIEVLFGIVILAEKALSREMEFQADLVAVSVTGSDALIHALYKLGPADEAFGIALGTASSRLEEKKAVPDLYALQNNHIEQMQRITDDPNYGKSPILANRDGKDRVFTSTIVNPPEMWASHPNDNDREENAKRQYIYADIDNRSSWLLFSQPENLRRSMTAELLTTSAKEECELIEPEESIALMNQDSYQQTYLEPKLKGVYLGRMPFANFISVEALYDAEPKPNLKQALQGIYTQKVAANLEQHRILIQEMQVLNQVKNEVLTIERRAIFHRGEKIKRSEVDLAISQVENEEGECLQKLMLHDQDCRVIPYQIAMGHDPALAAYLKSLSSLLHFAEHSLADILDLQAKLINSIQVAVAGSNNLVKVREVVLDANRLRFGLLTVYGLRNAVNLDAALRERFEGKAFYKTFPPFEMIKANTENINEWVLGFGPWVNAVLLPLQQLRRGCLDRLLQVEGQIQEAFLLGNTPEIKFGELATPQEYSTLLPGHERPLSQQLGSWDRFIIGDGLIPTAAKFIASALVIVGALYMGQFFGKSYCYIYNGFNVPLTVEMNGEEFRLDPFGTEKTKVTRGEKAEFVCFTESGDTLEYISTEFDGLYQGFIYNIAHGAAFSEYEIVYGLGPEPTQKFLPIQRFFGTDADYVLETPPETLKVEGTSWEVKYGVAPLVDVSPNSISTLFEKDSNFQAMVFNHCKLDMAIGEGYLSWSNLAYELESSVLVLRQRLLKEPENVVLNRFLLANAGETYRQELCRKLQKLRVENPENPDWFYMSTQCFRSRLVRDSLYQIGHQNWPQNQLLANKIVFQSAFVEDWERARDILLGIFWNGATMTAELKVRLLRLDRMTRLRNPVDSRAELIMAVDPIINYFQSLERKYWAETETNEEKAFYLLRQGEIERAMEWAKKTKDGGVSFSWQAAASNGASKELLEKVLAYPGDRGINTYTCWTAIALSAKHKKDYSLYLEKLKDFLPDSFNENKKFNLFLETLMQGDLPKSKNILAEVRDFEVRANYMLMGAIILEEKVPKEWHDQINQIVLTPEKPWLGDWTGQKAAGEKVP